MLIIDDEAMNIVVLSSLLTSRNISFDTATSGQEGLEKIQSRLRLYQADQI